MERIDSTCSLAIFSKSRPKRYGTDEVNHSVSSTNGRRSLLRWPTIFLLSEEMFACTFLRKRTTWVTASIAELVVRRPAHCCSSTWARGPTALKRRSCSQPRFRSASFVSFGIWGWIMVSSFSDLVAYSAGMPWRRPRIAARQCLSTLCEGSSHRSRRCQQFQPRRYHRFLCPPRRARLLGPEGEVHSVAYRPIALVRLSSKMRCEE